MVDGISIFKDFLTLDGLTKGFASAGEMWRFIRRFMSCLDWWRVDDDAWLPALDALRSVAASTEDISVRDAAHVMSMLLYELYPGGAGEAYAHRVAELPSVDPLFRDSSRAGWSYGEKLLELHAVAGGTGMNPRYVACAPALPPSLGARHPFSHCLTSRSGAFVLGGDGICAVRDLRGYLVLGICVSQDTCFLTMDPAGDDVFWFHGNTCIVSPVYRLLRMRHILQVLMAVTGYAQVPVRLAVHFKGRHAQVLDQERMFSGCWRGLPLTFSRYPGGEGSVGVLRRERLPHSTHFLALLSLAGTLYDEGGRDDFPSRHQVEQWLQARCRR